jgi:hypothetical protein
LELQRHFKNTKTYDTQEPTDVAAEWTHRPRDRADPPNLRESSDSADSTAAAGDQRRDADRHAGRVVVRIKVVVLEAGAAEDEVLGEEDGDVDREPRAEDIHERLERRHEAVRAGDCERNVDRSDEDREDELGKVGELGRDRGEGESERVDVDDIVGDHRQDEDDHEELGPAAVTEGGAYETAKLFRVVGVHPGGLGERSAHDGGTQAHDENERLGGLFR